MTHTLEEEIAALLAGELDRCLACGEAVETGDDEPRVECPACGSVLEAGSPPRAGPAQLVLL